MYMAMMAKFNNDQLVKSAAQAASAQTSDDLATANSEQEENDYKESLKAKAQCTCC